MKNEVKIGQIRRYEEINGYIYYKIIECFENSNIYRIKIMSKRGKLVKFILRWHKHDVEYDKITMFYDTPLFKLLDNL
jgi:hypothetical protein